MKMVKVDKCICLLTIIVCLMFFMTSLTVFAAHIGGNTEVSAHIETVATDATQSAKDNTSTVVPSDDTNISTGEMISVFTVITLVILIISAFTIYFLNKSSKYNKNIEFEKIKYSNKSQN